MKHLHETDVLKANLAIATGFLAIYLFTGQRHHGLLYVATAVGAFALLLPVVSRWVAYGWFKLAEGLGWVNSRIILSAVFFALLLPVALLFRLFNKSGVWFQRGRAAKSVYMDRNHRYAPRDLENAW